MLRLLIFSAASLSFVSTSTAQFGPAAVVYNRPPLTFPGPILRIADMDADGDQDIVATLEGEVVILSSTAAGNFVLTFAASAVLPTTNFSGARTVDEDLDGDGDVDLAIVVNFGSPTSVPSSSYRVYLLRNTGLMSFAFDGFITVNNGSGGGFNPRAQLAAAVDLNGDNLRDLVFQESTSNFLTMGTNDGARIIFNNGPTAAGNLSFSASITTPPLSGDESNIDWVLGDIDGDGDVDAAIAFGPQLAPGTATNSGVRIIINASVPGSPFFLLGPIIPVASIRKVRLADMDQDGLLDVVTMTSTPVGLFDCLTAEVHRNTTTPGMSPSFITVASVPIPHGYDLSIGDVNCDGVPDLVTSGEWTPCILPSQTQNCGPFGEMHLHAGNGTGTFLAPVSLNDHGRASILADLDGDSRLDLVYWRDYASDLIIRANSSTLPCPALPLLAGTVNGSTPAGGTLTFSAPSTLGFGLQSTFPGIAGAAATIFANVPPASTIAAVTPILGPLGSVPNFEVVHGLSIPAGTALALGDGLGVAGTPFVAGGIFTPLAVNDPYAAIPIPAGIFNPGDEIRLQALYIDGTTPLGIRASNVLRFRQL